MSDLARPRGETPIRSVFDRLRAKRESALPTRIPRLARGGGAYLLSDGQERLWLIDRMLPGNAAYNVAAAVEMAGPLDRAAFAAALIEIVRRHETLRTSFPAVGDQPAQVISPVAGSPLHEVDLGGLADGRRIADRIAGELAAAPFDLAGGALLRVGLLRLGPEEHRLILVLHHIVSDGWSLRILLRETRLLYQAFLERRPSPLPELAVQYVDFVDWQRLWLTGDAAARQLAYWKRELGERPPVLQLPVDRPRPAVQSLRGRSLPLVLPPGLSAEISALTRSAEVTPFITLLAAFQALLHRLSGQPEILVGFPIANRKRLEIQDLIGFFVNTLVLGARFSVGLRFHDLLRSTHEAALGAHVNQELPFGRLVKELQPARQTSHSPLVQVAFVYQNLEAASWNLPGLRLTPRDVPRASAMFDLQLNLKEEPLGFAGEIEHSTDLFDAATVSRWAGYLATLLAAVVADPERRVADLPLLSAAETQQLREANDTAVRFTAGACCLHELIAEQAAGIPDAIAVVAEEGALSYRELAARSARLARQLVLLGVGPDVRVGICLERSLELMVGLLAVLTAGGAYVPFDPSYPRERLAYMLADSAVPVLLSQPATLSALPDLEAAGVHVVLLDRAEGAPAACAGPGTVGAPTGHPENLAYVIYTSGSSGQPKGVMIPHRAIANRLLWMQGALPIGEADRVLQKTPISFDASVWELFVPLLAGARLVMARPGGHRDPSYLAAAIAEQGITVLQAVPSLLRVLLDEPGFARCHSLERVYCGGEALPADLAERFFARSGAALVNLYGPTETAIDATFWPCDPADRRGLVPIGRPVANTAIHLLDRDLHPVPLGVEGELHIGGVQVARGYLGRPELTAGRFVPDPSGDGARLYATGDLARRLPRGGIDYLGRLDHQVKIRGFRIELGEIEAVLGRLPEVGEAVVVAAPGRPGESARLVAYVVPDPEHDRQELERWTTGLRRRLQEELPEHMVPAAFVALAALPLTPSGKVDRHSLPAPDRGTREEQALVPPRNPTEEILAAIWTAVLGIERCGVEDDFFALGGHSLLASQVVSRIRDSLEVELPLHTFFTLPTVAALAERVEAARRTGATAASPAPPPLVAGERRGDEPLSFAQQRLWFLSQLDPESTAYHVPVALRLTGALSPPALAAALAFVVERHETLRTTFALRQDGPAQVVAPPSGWRLPVVDLAHLGEAEREAEMHRLAHAEAIRPFDLARGPLLRTLLVRLAEREHVFTLVMHHIVSDGWSMGVLSRESMALYHAAVAGKPPRLPPLPIQYRDFAAWQREWLSGETLERAIHFWRRQLAGAPSPPPPPPPRRRSWSCRPTGPGRRCSASAAAACRSRCPPPKPRA
jgi:amino acid adenylation domain-containing protein